MPPPLQQLGGETGGQQQQAWQSLDQDGDYPTQSKHGQYNKLSSLHSLYMWELNEGYDRLMWAGKQKCGGEFAGTNTHWPDRSFNSSVMEKICVLLE